MDFPLEFFHYKMWFWSRIPDLEFRSWYFLTSLKCSLCLTLDEMRKVKFLWIWWNRNYLVNGMQWLHYDSNYPITVSRSDSNGVSPFSSEGKGVSGLVFGIRFRVSDAFFVFLSGKFESELFDASKFFALDESDFDLESFDGPSRFLLFRFFDGRRSVGMLVRALVLEVGSVFDLILILKGISLRHVGR